MTHVGSIQEVAKTQLDAAHAAKSQRSAVTLYGGRNHVLRQTAIALVGGQALGEHESPGEATIHVLSGRVCLSAGDEQWELESGQFMPIPPSRHDLLAIEDAVVLLTVAVSRSS